MKVLEWKYQKKEDYDQRWDLGESTLCYYGGREAREKARCAASGMIGTSGKQRMGVFLYPEGELPVWETNSSRFRYRVDGYVETQEGECLAVLRDQGRKRLAMLLGSIAVLVALCFLLFSMNGNKQPAELGIDLGAEKYKPEIEVSEEMDPTKIALPGYESLVMAAGSDKLYAALWNPEVNPCYFKFSLVLKESGEILYESGLVPPGEAVTEVTLNRKMEEGEYPVMVKMDTFSLEDKTQPLNGGSSETILEVRKEE